jgi:enoyl-CoA hydratase/carnithine racemase
LERPSLAETIDAAEASWVGLLNRRVETGSVLAAAKEMVGVYAQRAPLSLAFTMRAVYRGLQMDLDSTLEFETFLVSTIYGTSDKQEGISAFLEKRQAAFKGSRDQIGMMAAIKSE